MTTSIQIKDKISEGAGIKVAPFRKNVRTTTPHKHNSYLELIFLTGGNGDHTIDEKKYPIEGPVLFIVRQDQLHFWNITSEPEGYVLLLKSYFVEQLSDPELKFLLARINRYSFIPCSEAQVKSIEALFELLVAEVKEASVPNLVVSCLLKALIAKMLSLSESPAEPQPDSHLFSELLFLLATHKKITNHVATYAGILNTTPQNLNAVCKKNSGQSASKIIAAHIIAEASRLLLYTSLSVSEIAYQLGFKDNSHFSKYFKKHSGKGPSGLRAAR